VLIAVVSAVACMTSSVQRWVGHTRGELVAARGEPDHRMPLSGGGELVQYRSPWNASSAGVCELSFVIDEAGVIRRTAVSKCRWNGWIEGPPPAR
jgi:hypothetical protein